MCQDTALNPKSTKDNCEIYWSTTALEATFEADFVFVCFVFVALGTDGVQS